MIFMKIFRGITFETISKVLIVISIFNFVLIPFVERPWYRFFNGAFLLVLGLFCLGLVKKSLG